MLLVPLELRRVLLSMHGCSTAIWQCREQCNFSTMKLMRALSGPMAEIRVAYSAGFIRFAGERSRGTSTGLNSIIRVVGNSNRAPPFSQRSNRLFSLQLQSPKAASEPPFTRSSGLLQPLRITHKHTTHTEPLRTEHRLPQYT